MKKVIAVLILVLAAALLTALPGAAALTEAQYDPLYAMANFVQSYRYGAGGGNWRVDVVDEVEKIAPDAVFSGQVLTSAGTTYQTRVAVATEEVLSRAFYAVVPAPVGFFESYVLTDLASFSEEETAIEPGGGTHPIVFGYDRTTGLYGLEAIMNGGGETAYEFRGFRQTGATVTFWFERTAYVGISGEIRPMGDGWVVELDPSDENAVLLVRAEPVDQLPGEYDPIPMDSCIVTDTDAGTDEISSDGAGETAQTASGTVTIAGIDTDVEAVVRSTRIKATVITAVCAVAIGVGALFLMRGAKRRKN